MRSVLLLIVESRVKIRLRQDLKRGRQGGFGFYGELALSPLIRNMAEDTHLKDKRLGTSRHTTKRSMLSSKYDHFCIAEVIRQY